MTVLGTSFTRWRAEALGLDYRRAFARICDMGFGVVRLSASWREVHEVGYEHLDWLVAYAEEAGQSILITVGMKALGWPEFYLPPGFAPGDAGVVEEAVGHVRDVVRRFNGCAAVVAWQIENEPFNRSGPLAQWIPRAVVRREAAAVRALDRSRPLAITSFAHFDEALDRASSRHQSAWKRPLGLAVPAEREALAVLRRGDILGVDVYRAIAWTDDTGVVQIGRALPDQLDWIKGWQRIAAEQRKRFWIMEAQAEPWEPRSQFGEPITIQPADIRHVVETYASAGIETILLWGSEYWLWRAEQGDRRWLEALPLGRQALAP